MRVALVHSFYGSGAPSGENLVVLAQAKHLESAGHEVCLVSVHTDDLVQRTGYRLRTSLNVVTGRGVDPTDQLAAFDPDVTHVHNLFPNMSTRWLRDWGGPLVSTVHNFRPACANGMLLRNGRLCTECPDSSQLHGLQHGCYRDSRAATLPLVLRNWRGVASDAVLTRSDRIIYPAGHVRAQYEGMGADPSKGVVVPNFVETGFLSRSSGLGDLGTRPPVADRPWLFVGRLSPEKGIIELLQAWPSDQRLLVCGDGILRSEVQALCRDAVTYLGPLDHAAVIEAIQSSCGLLFPSMWLEVGPLTYAEALACGRPVVAKSGNAAAFDIAESGTGAVFNTFEDVSRALDDVRGDWVEFCQRAERRYEEMFTPAAWLTRMTNCYESLVPRGNT